MAASKIALVKAVTQASSPRRCLSPRDLSTAELPSSERKLSPSLWASSSFLRIFRKSGVFQSRLYWKESAEPAKCGAGKHPVAPWPRSPGREPNVGPWGYLSPLPVETELIVLSRRGWYEPPSTWLGKSGPGSPPVTRPAAFTHLPVPSGEWLRGRGSSTVSAAPLPSKGRDLP